MDSTSDFTTLEDRRERRFKQNLKTVNASLNLISAIFLVVSVFLFYYYYYPRMEIEDAFLIFLPGVFGASLFLIRFASNGLKECYIIALYMWTGVFSLAMIGFMIANSGSPFFAPILNKIMTLVFVFGWDLVYIGSASLLKLTFLKNVNNQNTQLTAVRNPKIVIIEERNGQVTAPVTYLPNNYCPVHGCTCNKQ